MFETDTTSSPDTTGVSRNRRICRRAAKLAWLLLPIAVIGWHYGPGQSYLKRELAGNWGQTANAAADRRDWQHAGVYFDRALRALPDDAHRERQRLGISQAVARIQAGDMIGGQEQLHTLVEQLEGEEETDETLLTAARNELATACYHAAWLMRIEGASADEWKPEAEQARQHLRLLAELATGEDSDAFRKNLEATIKLEQMDLQTLLARPPPKNCPKCCKNLSQRKRKQCQSRCNNSGDRKGDGKQKKSSKKKQQPQDARKQVKKTRSAGLNQRQGGGS